MLRLHSLALSLAAALIWVGAAHAQEKNPTQPPPPAVPAADVESTPLGALAPTVLEGTGQAIDGDEIAIGDIILRLDGIAAPLMTVPMGPEARVALQALIDGQRLTCDVLDRSADGRVLTGICKIGEDDVAEAMLAGGLVAVYRPTADQQPGARERAARYDAAETEARERGDGIWAKAPTPEEITAAPSAPPQTPTIDKDLVRNWLSLAPFFLLALIAGGIALARGGAKRRAREERQQTEMRALLALFLGEVLAIRTAAENAQAITANIIQDLPIPTAQLANMALPDATVYTANAHRLKDLPREVSVDLVQFYARYQVVSRILKQASALRCEQLRASFQALIDSSDEPMARAEKLLR